LIDESNPGIVGTNLVENKNAPDGFDLGLDAPWKNAATKEKEATDQGASASFAVVHLRQELA
jgi:hypothetical protein